MQTRPCAIRPARRRSRRSGFTLVEIMIVVLVIGVLLNIASPAFVASRDKAQAKSCVKNLSDFAMAKEQYAMDNKVPAGNAASVHVLWPQISSYIKAPPGTNPVTGPVCPASGLNYDYQAMSVLPTCPYGASSATPQAVHAL